LLIYKEYLWQITYWFWIRITTTLHVVDDYVYSIIFLSKKTVFVSYI